MTALATEDRPPVLAPWGWPRWVRPLVWSLAIASLLDLTLRSATGSASDLAILWRSGESLVHGGPLYDPELEFIYPPLAGWLVAPLGLLPFRGAVVVLVLVSLAAAIAATVLLLRLVGVRASSPALPGVLFLLAHSRPLVGLLDQGNIDVLLLLAEVGVIALLVARRDVAAGVLLGAVCAVKPTLAPVVLALVVLGRVRGLVAAAVSGGALTLLGFLTVPDSRVFLTDVLPVLSEGNRPVLAPFNRSIHGAAVELGLPPALDVALRVAAFGLAGWIAWRRRSSPDAPLEVVPLLMLGTVLASSFAWGNYGIYLLPLLVTVARPGSLVQSWPAWAGVYLFGSLDPLGLGDLSGLPGSALRMSVLIGWSLLLASCAVAAHRSTPARTPGAQVAGTGPARPPGGNGSAGPGSYPPP